MRSFTRALAAERLKLSKSFIWLLIPISPLIALLIGMLVNLEYTEPELNSAVIIASMASFHAMLFLPILTGILSAFVCRYEHSGGGWKALLSLPLSRPALYIAKFTVVAGLLAVTQLLFVGAVIAASAYQQIDGGIAWTLILQSTISGWVACLPLAALQLWVSTGWSSFAAPLTINVMLTLPNMLIINSAKYGPYYPWAQPALAMLSVDPKSFGALTLPLDNILITIGGSFIVFFLGGMLYFSRKEI